MRSPLPMNRWCGLFRLRAPAAVKVQYIDMRDRFEGDLWTVEWLFDIAAFLFRGFDFGWIMKDARAELHKELDFELEARNGERCQRELRPLGSVHVPAVDWSVTSKRVLTSEFVDGVKVIDVAGLRRLGLHEAEVSRLMVESLAHQIFSTGFIHADPHPGNLLVRRDERGRAQLVLLDHGLYVSMADDVRHVFCQLWRHCVLRDAQAVRHYSQLLGVDDWELWASILFQRPFYTGEVGFGTLITAEDVELMRKASQEKMDQITDILKRLPRVLVLLMRNINLSRSINAVQ